MRELTQKEIVTIALYLLGGDKKAFDTEDIAVKSAEIAPGKFSWKKYRDNIDQELVRRSLTDAKLAYKYVVGSQKEGWMLSPSGLLFALESDKKTWAKPKARQPEREKLQANREKERLLSSRAYNYYLTNGEKKLTLIPQEMADDFFRLDDYVKGDARVKKITRIVNLFMNDPELGPVVKILAKIEKGSK
jgi:hypothetical protein